MRILVTGARGFAGRHLTRHLREIGPDDDVHGTLLPQANDVNRDMESGVNAHAIDLRDREAVSSLIGALKPDRIYHLAAQAAVHLSFTNPWATLENNIRSQLNLLEACREHNIAPRFLVVSTGEVYANTTPYDRPADEHTPVQPSSPYAVSKIAQEMLGIQYHFNFGLPIIVARPFNQFGPGQNLGFVAPDFANQIARIEAGLQPAVMRVGDLSARRDFTDVRDIVRAQRLILEHGEPGETYNIGTGKAVSIRDLLNTLLKTSSASIEVQPAPEHMRPAKVPLLWGSAHKLQAVTGWEPHISFEQSLQDILADFRQRVHLST